MKELLDWLQQQKGSLRTYIEFQERALALRAEEPQHAALLRLLADLVTRFADAYDGQPLSADVAARALDQLTEFLEKAVNQGSAVPSESLALLNQIGSSELT